MSNFYNSYAPGTFLDRLATQKDFGEKYCDYFNLNDNTSMNENEFLTLQKESFTSSDVNEPESAEDENDINSKEAQSVLKEVNGLATLQIVQNFYDLYISPKGATDVNNRLGKVIGEVDRGFTNKQTNSAGGLNTRASFETFIPEMYYSPLNDSLHYCNKPYVNLMFPPFKSVTADGLSTSYFTTDSDGNKTYISLSEYKAMKEAGTASTVSSEHNFDLTNLVSYRAGHTFRAPAFKSINDNILYIQTLLQGATGIVSTYLTEWDISLYIQEGLISPSSGTNTQFISLVHRLDKDNPMGYTDSEAASYGVLNSATSKLYKTNLNPWIPSSYPYSAFWTPYPQWKTYSNLASAVTTSSGTVQIPWFYTTAYNGQKSGITCRERLRFDDYRGAALSGWDGFSFPQAYKALYTTSDDGFSDVDINYLGTESGLYSFNDLINAVLEDTYGVSLKNSASNIVTSGCPVTDENGNIDSSDGTYCYGSSTYTNKSSNEDDIMLKKYNARSETQSNVLAQANSVSTGSTTSSSGTYSVSDEQGIMGITEATVDNAKTAGVPQYNPVLYGGPHGNSYSPMSIKGLFESSNEFLRNVPRLSSKSNSGDNEANFYYGPEKWCKPSTHINEPMYAHSFSKSLKMLRHGVGASIQVYGYVYSQENVWIDADYNNSCYYGCWAWPKYYQGQQIRQWYNNYRRYTTCTRECSRQEYYNSNRYRNGNYYYYSNSVNWNNYGYYSGYRTYRFWSGNYLWRVDEHFARLGVINCWRYKSYKRYLLHSEPNSFWTIDKVRNYWYLESEWYNGGFQWWNEFVKWIYGKRISWSFRTFMRGYRDEYELHVHEKGWHKLTYVNDEKYGNSFWVSMRQGEYDVMHKMVDNGRGVGATAPVIFCANGTPWSAPDALFRAPVTHKSKTYHYFTRHSRRYSCRRNRTYYIIHYGTKHYMTVDLSKCDFFVGNTGSTPNTTVNSDGQNLIKDSIPESSPSNIESPYDLISWYPTGQHFLIGEDADYTAYWAIHGWGLLGNIQGLECHSEDSKYEKFTDKTVVPNLNSNFNTALMDLNYRYFRINSYRTGIRNYGGELIIASGGFPNYSSYPLPYRIKQAIVNAFGSATFYKAGDMNTYYNVGFDVPVRLAYDTIYKQIGYLEKAKNVFCGSVGNKAIVDFDSMYTIMHGNTDTDGLISSRTLYLSDPNSRWCSDPSTGKSTLKSNFYGYNQWISEALKIFTNNSSTNAAYVAALRNNFDYMINNLNTCGERLQSLRAKRFERFSYNEVVTAMQTMSTLQDIANSDSYEAITKFILAYLNVLYEARRYFVNLRCNKQDGTYWVLRHLESMVPMVEAAAIAAKAKVDTSKFITPNKYKVAFYEVQNTNSMKVAAIRNNTTLDHDRIKTVYVKVEYTTKEKYDAEQAALTSGQEPTIVKVETWTYAKNTDGSYKVDAKGEKIRILSGKYKYAKKPTRGVYRLESATFLKNEANKKYNAALSTSEQAKKKVVDTSIDEAYWNITWGVPTAAQKSELGETDILFGMYNTASMKKLKDLAMASVTDPTELLCASKDSADYWQIHVEAAYPKDTPYMSDVKLVSYPTITSSGGSKTDPLPPSLLTIAAYQLYPIIEDQSEAYANLGDAAIKVAVKLQ